MESLPVHMLSVDVQYHPETQESHICPLYPVIHVQSPLVSAHSELLDVVPAVLQEQSVHKKMLLKLKISK